MYTVVVSEEVKMKRKKWTEQEEETLINKYSELQTTGALNKLRTREKKFQPIADHVNSVHHLQDPISYPFSWSWRDVSIKVQNMRHQYVGVKQKIRVSDEEFNWDDGGDHWTNFDKYKQVFGDVELDVGNGGFGKRVGIGGLMDDDVFGLELDLDCDDFDKEEDGLVGLSDGEDNSGLGLIRSKRLKRDDGIGILGAQILELRDSLGKKEERRREREFVQEEEELSRNEKKWERDYYREERLREREERMEVREFEWEERERVLARREFERRLKVEREFDEDRRRWLMKMEEKREEEEMAWRERMVAMQIDHEKQIMQMHADACQNQMQVLGVVVRLMCQFFGSGNDGLGGLGTLPPQVLHNLQHQGGLATDGEKPDMNTGSHFM